MIKQVLALAVGGWTLFSSTAGACQDLTACFVPPKNWELADPRSLAPKVTVGFLTKPRHHFCPSMNLAIEKVQVSLQEYLQIVKTLHESSPHNRWRDLGKIQTKAGTAELTEIDTKNKIGPVRILQMILIQDQVAYILTAAALKEDLPLFYEDFLQAFRSFSILPSLVSAVGSEEKKEKLQKQTEKLIAGFRSLDSQSFQSKTFQESHWIPFQQFISQEFSDLGMHWQFLILQQTQKELL